ncbi:DUF2092 domain-containing protein, partial [Algoriphagus sp.]|uniref:DUF2092 domain-containing protein n=1 Tax=Algoriphagus sp. TaxID=1872435 RepID=UPI0025D197C3
MKKILFGFLLFLPLFSVHAQDKIIDTTAVLILDRMSSIFGEMKALGFTSKVSKDVVYSENFFIKVFSQSDVKIKGPDKFTTRLHGENKEDLYSYNGKQVIYYSF